MATVAQFAAKPAHKNLAVFAGANTAAMLYCLDKFLSLCPPHSLLRYSATETPVKTFMEELLMQSPLDPHRVMLVSDIQAWKDFKFIDAYARRVSPDVTLVLCAEKTKRPDGQRWIAYTDELKKSKGVLYVDCGNLTEKSIGPFVSAAADCSTQQAEVLIDRTGGDLEEILRLSKLCALYDGDPPINLLIPKPDAESPLVRFGVTRWDSMGLWMQTHIAVGRLLQISLAFKSNMTSMNIPSHVGIEQYLFRQLAPVAKEYAPEEWMRRLDFVANAERYMFMPHFRQYLELGLK